MAFFNPFAEAEALVLGLEKFVGEIVFNTLGEQYWGLKNAAFSYRCNYLFLPANILELGGSGSSKRKRRDDFSV
jgi:hypothetical protein